jgi:nicotinamidase-related amidase
MARVRAANGRVCGAWRPVVSDSHGVIGKHIADTARAGYGRAGRRIRPTRSLRPKIGPVYRHRGTPGYEIEASIAPLPDDVVVDKLTSGAFTGTYLDHALRNLGVTNLAVVGVVTDMCVLGTARAAAELGYWTVMVEDGCASYTERAHIEALLAHARVFGRVATSDEVMTELGLGGSAVS